MHTGVSASFRKRLRAELPAWQQEGLVGEQQAQALSQRYRLDELAHEGAGRLIAAIYILGAILIGGGLITFVAAHWGFIPRAMKIAMIFTLMLGLEGGGIWLWMARSRVWLGHSLVVAGVLAMGAAIGLMAQAFHVRENMYNGVLAWCIGAMAMAYALRSMPVSLVSLAISFIWFCGNLSVEAPAAAYPLVAAAVFAPMILFTRSAVLFVATALAVGLAIFLNLGHGEDDRYAAVGAIMPVLLYAVAAIWLHRRGQTVFAGSLVVLSLLAMAVTAYILSFQGSNEWLDWRYKLLPEHPWRHVALYAASAAAVALWAIEARRRIFATRLGRLAVGLLAACAFLAATLLTWNTAAATILANAALLVLVVALVADGVTAVARGTFWCGVLLAALMIVSRFLEYETGLMIKAAVFVACGVALIVLGVKFENYARARRSS